jgi:hypothetical protein
MTDDTSAQADAANASLAEKYRAFLENLSADEFALYRSSLGANDDEKAEVSGFGFGAGSAAIGFSGLGSSMTAPLLGSVVADVVVNKAKTADKAYAQMDAYIRQ